MFRFINNIIHPEYIGKQCHKDPHTYMYTVKVLSFLLQVFNILEVQLKIKGFQFS
jgi:hypothetical protein